MMNRDQAYLQHIVDAVDLIQGFTAGVTREQFDANREKQSAVILQLTLIGEMTKRLSEKSRTEIDLPWKDIAGFRDRAIHDYYTLDLTIVWSTAMHDIQVIRERVEAWLTAHKE